MFYQKNHGLPSLGKISKNGEKGQSGNSVYFGFVNDFFNGISLNASSWVLYGSRLNSNVENTSVYYTAYIKQENNIYTDSSYIHKVNESTLSFIYNINGWNDPSQGYDLTQDADNTKLYISNTPIYANYIAVDALNSSDNHNINIMSFAAYRKNSNSKYSSIYNTSVLAIDGIVYKSTIDSEGGVGLNKVFYGEEYSTEPYTIDYLKDTTLNSDNVEKSSVWTDSYGNTYSKESESVFSDDIKALFDVYESASARMDWLGVESMANTQASGSTIRGKLKMDKNDNIILKYPTTLLDSFKAGDVLYFWTDEQQFKADGLVTHMIVLTDDLLGADIDSFLKNATIENPFQISAIEQPFINSSDFLIDNKSIFYRFEYNLDDLSNYEKQVYHSNFYNLLDKDEYALTFGEFNDDSSVDVGSKTQCVKLLSKDASKNYFDIDFDVESKVFNVSVNAKSLRINDLYINKDCDTTNFELTDNIFDKDLIFDESGYIHTFTEDDYDFNNKAFIINPLNYFNNVELAQDCIIGCLIKNTTSFAVQADIISALNKIVLPSSIVEDTDYYIWTYLFNTTMGIKYYSQPILFRLNSADNSVTINNVVSSANKEVVVDDSDNDEYISFVCESISPEQTTNAEFSISYGSEVSNVKVYFNSNLFVNGQITQGNWYSISKTDTSQSEQNTTLTFSINCDNNLPNINNSINNSIDDYLKSFNDTSDGIGSFYQKLYNGEIYSTTNRTVAVTIRFDVANTTRQVYYEITQQGFTDPRQFLDFNIQIENNPVVLEQLNSHDNGVLANQFQFYTKVVLNTPSLSNYVDDLTVTLNVENLNYDYSVLYNNNSNATLFPTIETIPSLSTSLVNNYISITNYIDDVNDEVNYSLNELNTEHSTVINNSSILCFRAKQIQASNRFTENTLTEIEDCETIEKIQNASIASDFIIGDELSIIKNTNASEILKSGCLINQTKVPLLFIISNNSDSQIEKHFRTVVETGNPVPAHFNFMWCVKSYTVTYSINNSTYSFTNNGLNLCTTKTMDYSHLHYNVWSQTSNKFSFWINPISMTAVPKNYENSYNIMPSIYMKGSDEEVGLSVSQYKQSEVESEINSNINLNSDYYSTSNCAANNILKLPNYILTKNLFQDDVKAVNVYAFDFNENFANVNNIFKSTLNLFGVDSGTYTQNVLNWGDLDLFESPTYENTLTVYDDNSFIGLTYNYNLMLAKKRNDILSFFYNGEQFEANRYAQKNYNAPLFINAEVNYEFRSNDTLESIENYNKIYQMLSGSLGSVSNYSGVISSYADGYNYLNQLIYTDENDTDYLDLQASMSESVFTDAKGYGITLSAPSKTSSYYPYYLPRTLLYNIAWEYPKYTNDSTIIPFKFVDNMEYNALAIYLNRVFETNNINYSYGEENPNINLVKDYTQLFSDDADIDVLNLLMQNDELLNSAVNGERFMPYTECYDVYPRIAYNSKDESFNVLMLRKPSIVEEGQYKFNTTDLKIALANGQSVEPCTPPYSTLS